VSDRSFIDQLDEVWSRIAQVGGELDVAEWDLPTDCPGWTVRDQVSHLIGTESMLLGRSSPPPAPGGLAYVKNPIGEFNEAWVQERRSWPPGQVLAEFDEVTRARLAALRAMSDDELAAVGPSPIGQVPYATFMDVRVMDCWVHEQDIRRAVGRPGGLTGPAADAAVRRLTSSLAFVVGKRVSPPDGTSVVVELTGPVARTIAVTVSEGRAVAGDAPAAPTVTIATDAETYTCLANGRWTGAEAVEQGRVSFAGDAALGRLVVDNLATMI
jgi:uncharacterized protein (TIGR03083 family)